MLYFHEVAEPHPARLLRVVGMLNAVIVDHKAERGIATLMFLDPDAIALMPPIPTPMATDLMRTPAGLRDHLPRNLLRIAPLGQRYGDNAVIEKLAVAPLRNESVRGFDVLDADRDVVDGGEQRKNLA